MRHVTIVFVLGIVLTLAACGRRGPLELPEGTAAAPATEQNQATVPTIGTQKKKTTATTQIPSEPFILDPLLD
jgi:predicted small lipoprotein YifL